MTPSLEGWATKAKETPSLYEVRLSPLDTNPVFNVSGLKCQLVGNFDAQGVETNL